MGFWPFKSNFTLIAENTTKYYLELQSRYENRFTDNTSLLATTGVLDAQNYIFTSLPTITIEMLLILARESTTDDESHTPIREQILFEKNMQQYHDGKISSANFLSGHTTENSSTERDEVTDALFDFVFGLEIFIFHADSPNLAPSMIIETCNSKYKTIEKAIAQTINKHKVGTGIYAKATTNFMESPKFQAIRQTLGIIS